MHDFPLKMSMCSEMGLGCSFQYLYQALVEFPYVLLAESQLTLTVTFYCLFVILVDSHFGFKGKTMVMIAPVLVHCNFS